MHYFLKVNKLKTWQCRTLVWLTIVALHCLIIWHGHLQTTVENKKENHPFAISWIVAPRPSVTPLPPQPQQKMAPRTPPVVPAHEIHRITPKQQKAKPIIHSTQALAELPRPAADSPTVAASSPAAKASAAEESPDRPDIPITVENLRFRRRITPRYLPAAQAMGNEGTVTIAVSIDESGMPDHVEIKHSSGFSLLDNAAVDAANDSRFYPYLVNGQAKRITALIPYYFSLHQS